MFFCKFPALIHNINNVYKYSFNSICALILKLLCLECSIFAYKTMAQVNKYMLWISTFILYLWQLYKLFFCRVQSALNSNCWNLNDLSNLEDEKVCQNKKIWHIWYTWIRFQFGNNDHIHKMKNNLSERKACAALGRFRPNIVASINGVFISLFITLCSVIFSHRRSCLRFLHLCMGF